MKHLSLAALVLSLSLPAYAQDEETEQEPVVPVLQARLFTEDGRVIDVGAGLWVEQETAMLVGKELRACKAYKDSLTTSVKETPVLSPPPVLLIVGGVLLAGAGVGAGLWLAKRVP